MITEEIRERSLLEEGCGTMSSEPTDQKPAGREDWEWVSMENYSKDTQELTEQAADIIAMQAKEIRELKRMFALLVHCAGRVEIPVDMIRSDQAFTVTRENCFDTDSIVYEGAVA